jgi:TldD protein
MSTIEPFPTHLEPARAALPAVVAALEQGRTAEWYAFATLHEDHRTFAVVQRTTNAWSSHDRGAVLRILAGRRNFELATNDLTPEGLLAAAQRLRARVEAVQPATNVAPYSPLTWAEHDLTRLPAALVRQLPADPDASTQVHFGVTCEIAPAHTDQTALMAAARAVTEQIASHNGDAPTIVITQARQVVSTTVFVDRHRNMSQSLVYSAIGAQGLSPQGKSHREMHGGVGGIELITLDETAAERIATLPGQMASAERLTPGRYKLITAPAVTGVIAHEAFGHTQEGDTRVLGRSCASLLHAEQTRVGAPGATIVNDAGIFELPGGGSAVTNGSYFFDDEGQLASTHVILDDGLVQSGMNDLMSSLVGDIAETGPRQANGRRESWRRPLFARQSNTHFTPGDKTLEDLIGAVDYGFLAEWITGGMEDPKGMGLTAGTPFVREIRDGALTGKMYVGAQGGSVELSDPVPTILHGLVAKTAAHEVHSGGCQKYHKETLSAGIGGPWILWEGIQCG